MPFYILYVVFGSGCFFLVMVHVWVSYVSQLAWDPKALLLLFIFWYKLVGPSVFANLTLLVGNVKLIQGRRIFPTKLSSEYGLHMNSRNVEFLLVDLILCM